MQTGDVYRFGMPRGDLQVKVAGVIIKPALALGSWIAFKATPTGTIAMGDMVLLESEVAPVMSRLQAAGIEQTAVHHHVLHETPRIVYMHLHGHGDPVKIAHGVREALALTGTPSTISKSSTDRCARHRYHADRGDTRLRWKGEWRCVPGECSSRRGYSGRGY